MKYTPETKKVAEAVIFLNFLGFPAMANHDFTQCKVYGQDMVYLPNIPKEMRCSKLSLLREWAKLKMS